MTNADVASEGKADSFLKTATGLQQDAETREAWINNMIEKSPTFQYWNTILKIEITGLIMIRARRDQNFPLYVESLKESTPWFFALLLTIIMPDGCRSTSMTWNTFLQLS